MWLRWLVAGLVAANAVWMAYDGGRALLKGDYTTPSAGPHAGQLGPWAGLLRAVGFDPRATPVKVAFVVYGLAALVGAGALLVGAAWAPRALLVLAALGLWYVPGGTLLNLVAIVLLLLPAFPR